jgi:hypothetical protein
MNERICGLGMALCLTITTLGVTTEIEGCGSSGSGSGSSSKSDDCSTACAKGQGKPNCVTTGIDGGPDCTTQCRNPPSVLVPPVCASVYQALVHCTATTGTVVKCDATTNVPTVSGCDSQVTAYFSCLFPGVEAGLTD